MDLSKVEFKSVKLNAADFDERSELTLAQALRWRDWPRTDRNLIERAIERVGATRFYRVPSDGYVACLRDCDWDPVMYVHPGYIESAEIGRVLLSGFRGRSSATQEPVAVVSFCPTHPWLALPASGICDDCG